MEITTRVAMSIFPIQNPRSYDIMPYYEELYCI